MSESPTVGTLPHAITDAPRLKNTDARTGTCCQCRADADGYCAVLHGPACADCAAAVGVDRGRGPVTDGGWKPRELLELELKSLKEENKELREEAERAQELRYELAEIIREAVREIVEANDGIDPADIEEWDKDGGRGRGPVTDGGYENILGTYRCRDCGSDFKVTGSSVTSAYEGWTPTCPVCGTRNDIQQTGRPDVGGVDRGRGPVTDGGTEVEYRILTVNGNEVAQYRTRERAERVCDEHDEKVPSAAPHEVEKVELATDGGEKLVHSDAEAASTWDPDKLPSRFTPAVVECKDADEITTVSYANVSVKDSGALRYVEWLGRSGKIPPWRWTQVAELQTNFNDDGGKHVVDEDYQYLPPEIRENDDGETDDPEGDE
ncbi:hypothetical protein [Halorientalis litorea]|uniref:hypothetical protein n=1 Tax=Halorientalis litorea TaxID=2931977 RepID=UPI001FF56AB8|nr:hypothetical protein [Halorientalis litorea]